MRSRAIAAILVSTTFLSGCAGSIAGVSLSSISSFAGFASTLFTGADLGEHAASLVTGKDCRFSEGLVREDRDICEEVGSPATRNDFHGIFVERVEADGTVIYAAPKYMPASVGAGENENNADVVWAQIKAQKAREETERQLARSEQGQQIDVAALASGSLSSQSLGFLPVGFQASAQTIDEEPASQTAVRPRNFSNPVDGQKQRAATQVHETLPEHPSEPPAIDEKTFKATLHLANATGAGGPFIAATTNATPVVSTLVNGEPVLVMRIGPVISPLAFATPAEPIEAPAEIAPVEVAVAEPAPPAPSPQALVSSLPKAVKAAPEETPAPAKPVSKPKPKAAPIEVAEALPPKPAKAKPAAPEIPAPAPTIAPEDDAYQPPSNDVFNSPAPDLMAPSAPAAALVESAPASATTGPAPLIPMPQP